MERLVACRLCKAVVGEPCHRRDKGPEGWMTSHGARQLDALDVVVDLYWRLCEPFPWVPCGRFRATDAWSLGARFIKDFFGQFKLEQP